MVEQLLGSTSDDNMSGVSDLVPNHGERGTVYILEHFAMPDIVKIGQTTDLTNRMKQLNNTSVPGELNCYYAAEVDDYKEVERQIHRIFGDKAIGKEFPRVEPDRVALVLQLAKGTEVTPTATSAGDSDPSPVPSRFSFRAVGIPPDKELVFTRDEEITCYVASDKTTVVMDGTPFSHCCYSQSPEDE